MHKTTLQCVEAGLSRVNYHSPVESAFKRSLNMRVCFLAAFSFAILMSASSAPGDEPLPLIDKSQARVSANVPPELAERGRKAVENGLKYLASQQDKHGGWTSRYGPAVTAIVTQAFVNHPEYGRNHDLVKRAISSILKHEQPDGGIYERGQNLANYQTSVVLTMLAGVDDPALNPRIAKAQAFLCKLQYDENESIDDKDPWYGGAGYNSSKRPDLSNTQMMLEALHASGLPASDPTYQKALKFVSRCQLNDATNDQSFADGRNDGGFIYTPTAGGQSKANGLFDGKSKLRSYGSMSYAGFKSMLYANVGKDDPRIKAAINWIRSNYTVDSNANMPHRKTGEGLYYYFHVFARALKQWGEPVIVDVKGQSHNWRVDLISKICSLQGKDGSWKNDEDRWLEGDPNYVTALAILSLQTALAP